MRIFLAGATGVIGQRLIPLLRAAGHEVFGTTRFEERAAALAALGVRPVVLDALDGRAVFDAVADAAPAVLIHQLTDLPRRYDAAALPAAIERTSRLRVEGTRNLVIAAIAAGVARLVAQSICFMYAPGPEPHDEGDPLDLSGSMAKAAAAIAALERLVTQAGEFEGLVLRYGRFYGPGTWSDVRAGRASVHVDAAAHAAFLAVSRGRAGIYNVAEDDGMVSVARARRELGWDPQFRLAI